MFFELVGVIIMIYFTGIIIKLERLKRLEDRLMKKCCTKDCNACPKKTAAKERVAINETITFIITLIGLLVSFFILTLV